MGDLDPDRKPVLGRDEPICGKQVQDGRQRVSVHDQVNVRVRPGLPTDEGVHAPAAADPQPHGYRGQPVYQRHGTSRTNPMCGLVTRLAEYGERTDMPRGSRTRASPSGVSSEAAESYA